MRKLRSLSVVALLILVTFSTANLIARPRLNAPRVHGEPGWAGKIFLFGAKRRQNKAIPILERDYRLFHVYGNMVRRHHYRDTVIPSHQDRTDALQSFFRRNRDS